VWIATACDCWLLEQNKMRYVRGQTNTHTDGQTDTVITSVFAALPYQGRRNKHIKQVKLIIWTDIHIKIKCTHKTWPTQDTEHPAICYTHSWRSCVCHDIGHNRTMSLREVFFSSHSNSVNRVNETYYCRKSGLYFSRKLSESSLKVHFSKYDEISFPQNLYQIVE